MTQVCVIFGAGEYYAGTPVVPAGAYVIAADGGLDHTRQLGIVPDVVVGDFDSMEGRRPPHAKRPHHRIAFGKGRSRPAVGFEDRLAARAARARSTYTARSADESTIRFPAFN